MRLGGAENWAKYAPTLMTYVPGLLRTMRLLIFLRSESDWRLFVDGEWARKERKNEEIAEIKRMKSIVPAKYHEILTPDYEFACKRRIFDV